MPVRIPTDASPQLQDALRGIELRLAALEARPVADPGVASQVSAVRTQLDALAAGPAYGDEWDEMVPAGPQHQRGLTPDPAPNAGLGTERVLHENGTWRRVLDGLAQAIPEGIGRPTHATRVLEILADLAVAGSIGATEGHFKRLYGDPTRLVFPGAWLSKANFSHNSTGNWIKVTLDTANEDTDSLCDPSNNRMVIRTAGEYELSAYATWDTNAAGLRYIAVDLGATRLVRNYNPALAYIPNHSTGPFRIRLAAGDLLTMWAYQNSGTTVTMAEARLQIRWVRL